MFWSEMMAPPHMNFCFGEIIAAIHGYLLGTTLTPLTILVIGAFAWPQTFESNYELEQRALVSVTQPTATI